MGYCFCFSFLHRNKLKRNISDKESSYIKEASCGSISRSRSRSRSGSLASASVLGSRSSSRSRKVNEDLRQEPSSGPEDGAKTSEVAPIFTYEELAIATNNFHPDCFLSRGGFGAVYKGKLESTGQVVAVKQLDLSGIQGEKEFLVEVLMLSLLHHPNLVNLIGYCAEGEQRLLVYEFLSMGSLEDHLFDVTPDMEPLDWNTRMQIAEGAVKGLHYLHNADTPVIYRDLKASNILLDEGFQTKLSDFGLAKFGPVGDISHVSTRVMGTYGYCAPEYASTGRLTVKTDIYSFGVVLLELITGYRAVDDINGRHMHLIHWALPLMKDRGTYLKLADPLLRGGFSVSVFNKAIEVALICLNENANLRPSTNELVSAMDYLVSHKYDPSESENATVRWPEIDFPSSITAMIAEKDLDRDRAVAEAKMWGESWRGKRQ